MKPVEKMQIAFVGMGEAASAFCEGWGESRAGRIKAYDIKMDRPASRDDIVKRCKTLGVACEETLANAICDADLVFSTVMADQAVIAAEQAAPFLKPGAYWCDLNSCAPTSKGLAEQYIDGAKARYVDVAVMAPVYPKRHLVPVLISGKWSADIAPILEALPMALRVVDGPVGRASSIKMVRSIFVKGMEALTAECTLAAAAAGVTDEVLPSLKTGRPHVDLEAHAVYNFERSLTHGARRSAEMVEVAKMLDDLRLPKSVSGAAANWQKALGEIGNHFDEGSSLEAITAYLLPKLKS